MILINQKVQFQILIRRSTLQLAREVEATDGDLPFGATPWMPSQTTRIPTFLVVNPPIFTLTFVSNSIFNGIPIFFFLFRSDLRVVTDSESRSLDVDNLDRIIVVFFAMLVNKGKDPLATSTCFEKTDKVMGS